MLLRSPNSLARLQWLRRLAMCIVALLMISVTRPGAEDGTLHAFSGAPAMAQMAGNVYCGAAHDLSNPTLSHALPAPQKKGKNLALSFMDSASCTNLYYSLRGYMNAGQWQTMYDSGKYFILSCANSLPPGGRIESCEGFSQLDIAVQNLGYHYPRTYHEYGEWVRSVLYLNTTDPCYFCSAALRLGDYYVADTDTTMATAWKTMNTGLAIDKWLWENCPECDTAALKQEYDRTRLSASGHQYDTTLPTMQELGLDTLLAKHAFYQNLNHNFVHGSAPQIISNASAKPNPTNTGTVLTFGMGQNAYVRIELFDLLGNVARGSAFEQYMGAGNHSVPIDMSALPSGTYYARIVTAYGETRTVKIVKE